MIEVLFWIFILIITYVYFCYPFLLFILSKLRHASTIHKVEITPTVSLIVAAYNEEKVIGRKIENSLELNYPRDNLEIIIASDGSTDTTNEIVKQYADQGVKLVALETIQGKSAVQNLAVSEAHSDIIIFTDANVILQPDAVSKIVNNFGDEKIGCVVGKVTYLNEKDTSVSKGEGVYWQYELFLRKKESDLGNLAMGSGPIMAIRGELFEPIDPNVGEDFVLPVQVVIEGYRVIYEPEAVSEEILFQDSPNSMFKSKMRIISKDLRGLVLNREILNPFLYPLYAWGLISHKLLRWLVPYFLILILIANPFLLPFHIYQIIFILQIVFYLSALTGYLWQRKAKLPFIFGIPFSFCLVNLAALVGVARFLMGKKSGQWEPVRS